MAHDGPDWLARARAELAELEEHQLKAMTEYRRHLARRVWLGTRKLPQ